MYHAPSGQGCNKGNNCQWLHEHEILKESPKIRGHKAERQQRLQRQLDEKEQGRQQLDAALGGGYKETKHHLDILAIILKALSSI